MFLKNYTISNHVIRSTRNQLQSLPYSKYMSPKIVPCLTEFPLLKSLIVDLGSLHGSIIVSLMNTIPFLSFLMASLGAPEFEKNESAFEIRTLDKTQNSLANIEIVRRKL